MYEWRLKQLQLSHSTSYSRIHLNKRQITDRKGIKLSKTSEDILFSFNIHSIVSFNKFLTVISPISDSNERSKVVRDNVANFVIFDNTSDTS